MPESQTQREKKRTSEELQSYVQQEETSFREYLPGVRVWRYKQFKYEFEGLGSGEQIDRQRVEALFEKEDVEPKTSSMLLSSFQDTALYRLVSESKSVVIQSRAIEEFLRRESDVLPGLLVQELERKDLKKPSWRNTLLLAAEHVQFTDLSHRKRLRECLKLHSKAMKGEWHPRTQSALRASLRMLLSLMADWRDSLDLIPFLILDYPVRIKRIALLGIQNLFRDFPPPPNDEETLNSFRRAIAIIAESYLTPSVCSESEDEFDLGLDALDTLIKLAEPCVSNLIYSVVKFAESWTIKQIKETLHKTHEAWLKGEFPNRAACLDLILECRNILNKK